jgi:hypothetical protein
MISEQNSILGMVDVGNTSNQTLVSSTLDTNSVDAKPLSAVAIELPYVEF